MPVEGPSTGEESDSEKERPLLELSGILTDNQASALERAIEERRKRRHRELEHVVDRIKGIDVETY